MNEKSNLENKNKPEEVNSRREFLKDGLVIGASITAGLTGGRALLDYFSNKRTEKEIKKIRSELGVIDHNLPELSKETLDQNDIQKYIEGLKENEKKELEVCFDQYKDIYSKYKDIELSKEQEKELHCKFYGLFAKYCKNFAYINQDPNGTALASNRRDTITYNFPKEEVNQPDSLVTDKELFDIFNKNKLYMSNFFLLITELSHSVAGDSKEQRQKKFIDDNLRVLDSIKIYQKERGYPEEDRDFIESSLKYGDPTFAEYQAHQITERAIMFYLLDCLPSKKDFEENYSFVKSIYEEVMKSNFEESNFEKSKVLSLLLRPKILNLVIDKNLNLNEFLFDLKFFKDLPFGSSRSVENLLENDLEGFLNIKKYAKTANSFMIICQRFISGELSLTEFESKVVETKNKVCYSPAALFLVQNISREYNIYPSLESKIPQDSLIWSDLTTLILFSEDFKDN
ncbi:MAG: hypothetical protein QG583_743 [Patescibacteria group bacterium]|nr:hypothetical protein [Patescibacteria group bacterium]